MLQSGEPLNIKTCPRCKNDVFRVCKTWHGEERFFQKQTNSFGKESVTFKEEEYHLIQCVDCGHEISDIDKLYMPETENGYIVMD